MKFRRLSSVALAAALMATSTAIVSYATVASDPAQAIEATADGKDWIIRFVVDKKEETGVSDAHNENTLKIGGVRYYVTFDEGAKESTSATGAICINGTIAGWKQIEWGAGKAIEPDWENGIIEYKANGNIFVEGDNWAQLWLRTWSAGDITSVEKIEVFDASGNNIWVFTKSGSGFTTTTQPAAVVVEETTAETEAPAEEVTEAPEAPVEDEADEPEEEDEDLDLDLDDDDDDEDDDEDDELDEFLDDLFDDDEDAVDEDDDAADAGEIDWTQYDAAKMQDMNDNFKLGDKLDLYAILGDDWDKFVTIEADFSWTPGEKWCGGAGIGAAVNCEGSTWIQGTEFGAANANEGVAGDGRATQTILEMAAPLEAIASVDDAGNWSFGELQVQNWWNGTEAGARVDAIRFLDEDGEIVGQVIYNSGNSEVPDVAPTTGNVDAATDSSKGSPDTGVADVAAIAGLAVVAAGAVIVAKKRK